MSSPCIPRTRIVRVDRSYTNRERPGLRLAMRAIAAPTKRWTVLLIPLRFIIKPSPPRWLHKMNMKKHIAALVVWAVIPLLVLLCLPARMRSHRPTPENECMNFMRQVAMAKEMWQSDNPDVSRPMPPQEAFAQYLKGGWERMQCPAGGHYDIGNTIDAPVNCSVHGSVKGIVSAREQRARRSRILSIVIAVAYAGILGFLIATLIARLKCRSQQPDGELTQESAQSAAP